MHSWLLLLSREEQGTELQQTEAKRRGESLKVPCRPLQQDVQAMHDFRKHMCVPTPTLTREFRDHDLPPVILTFCPPLRAAVDNILPSGEAQESTSENE